MILALLVGPFWSLSSSCFMTSSVRGNTPPQPSSVIYRKVEFIWPSWRVSQTFLLYTEDLFSDRILPGVSGSFALLVTPQLFYHLSTVLTSSLTILDDPLPLTFDFVFAALAPGEQRPLLKLHVDCPPYCSSHLCAL